LREVVELLMWELSAISNRKWRSAGLKKKKEVLAIACASTIDEYRMTRSRLIW